MARNADVDWQAVDDVIYGCANQAGEENRNVARISLLLAGLPLEVTGTTVNRLCGSGLDAVLIAARQIAAGEATAAVPEWLRHGGQCFGRERRGCCAYPGLGGSGEEARPDSRRSGSA